MPTFSYKIEVKPFPPPSQNEGAMKRQITHALQSAEEEQNMYNLLPLNA